MGNRKNSTGFGIYREKQGYSGLRVVIVQGLGKYMIIGYLDPIGMVKGSAVRIRTWPRPPLCEPKQRLWLFHVGPWRFFKWTQKFGLQVDAGMLLFEGL